MSVTICKHSNHGGFDLSLLSCEVLIVLDGVVPPLSKFPVVLAVTPKVFDSLLQYHFLTVVDNLVMLVNLIVNLWEYVLLN